MQNYTDTFFLMDMWKGKNKRHNPNIELSLAKSTTFTKKPSIM